MKNADRDHAIKMLKKVAAELANAPANTAANAKAYAWRSGHSESSEYAHQSGGLEHVCESSARAIQAVIDYMTPQPVTRRSPRARR